MRPAAISLNNEYLGLLRRLGELNGLPAVAGVYLPEIQQHPEFVDEFGFVFLEDGSVGPFYVSLPDVLERLWERHPHPSRVHGNVLALAGELAKRELPDRALALGAFNAASQHLMRRAGFRPPGRGAAGGPKPGSGETVGMVGYFCPIIDRLVARGVTVRVLEKLPNRVPTREGVQLVSEPRELGQCRIVICTASTLVNDTLETILDACPNAESIELIGPSSSGLPDLLFARGVRMVGGILYDDVTALRAALAAGQNWGDTGTKYEITKAVYPGFDALLCSAKRAA